MPDGFPFSKGENLCLPYRGTSDFIRLLSFFEKPPVLQFCAYDFLLPVEHYKKHLKIISKNLIEAHVADVCAELLTPERIRIIAEEVIAACHAGGEYLSIKKLKAAIKEADEAIENLWIALEKGQSVERITKRIEQREAEKKELEKQLAKEKRKQPGLQLSHILAFLDYLRELPGTSEVKRKSLINIFVNSVHLYDDYYTIIFNAGNATLRSENIPFRSIENSLKQAVFQTFSGSDFDAFVPPNEPIRT